MEGGVETGLFIIERGEKNKARENLSRVKESLMEFGENKGFVINKSTRGTQSQMSR